MTFCRIRSGIKRALLLMLLISAMPAYSQSLKGLSVQEVRQRAEAGDPAAQNQLGDWYGGSDELGYNEAEMIRWYEKAATNGHPEAQVSYASLFLYGRGRPVDMTQARIWYERAAEQGHHIGQFNTGIAYELGDGAAKDPKMAYLWFFLAASTGTPDQAAQKLYERKRDEAKALLSGEELAEISGKIEQYQRRFASQ